MKRDIQEVLISEEELQAAVKKIGDQISKDFEGKDPIFVGVLKGCWIFMADLMRYVTINCSVDFMSVSSYSGTSSTGAVKITKDLSEDIEGRHDFLLEFVHYPCNGPRCQRAGRHRAFRYFTESGVYDTAEHSGILIFVSFMEHQVRILADSGIAKRISQDLWNLIADELAEDIKNGKTAQAFLNAISKCGDLLAEQFPAKEENPNELSDGLVILGDLEWY